MILPSRLLPGALLSCQLAGAAPASLIEQERAAEPDAVPYELGDPGNPSPTPTLLIALFDDSGSVTGRGGNDPLSGRYAEAEHAFRVVARRGSRRERGAVLHFDSPCRGDVPPVSLTRRGMRRLRAGLREPRDSAGTSVLEPSLQRAVALARRYPQHATTLIILSDFLLLDAEPGQVLSELAAFPGAVHAVVLGSHLPDGVLPGNITVTPISWDSPPGAVAQAVFASLTAFRDGSSPTASSANP
ncbi:hypothetical protein [Amycolatopsis samaneae]|uniref:VWFA domain-containing protein n=1 Tax=Amycolatopsis samaneae TaxID=664691 RepID=A0ABW5GIB2_9PSEU